MKSRLVAERLRALARGDPAQASGKDAREPETPTGLGVTRISQSLASVRRIVSNAVSDIPGRLLRGTVGERLRLVLVRSGIPLRPEELLGGTLLASAAAGVLGFLILRQRTFVLILSIVALAIPATVLLVAKSKRDRLMEPQILNFLVMVANSLRAGHSFVQALELVAKDIDPPLSLELAKVSRECRLGASLEDALTGLVERVGSKDLELAVTGVLIQRQVGGNLSAILDTIALTIDKRIKTRAKIRVVTAQGRVSAWVVSLLPFILAGVVFGMYPDFGRIMLVTPAGRAMILVSLVMLVIGIALVIKVVNIDV